jgi:hypothetical protein
VPFSECSEAIGWVKLKSMKKSYVKPSVEVIKVETTKMMATSIGIYGDSVDSSTQLGRDYVIDFE